MTTGFNLRTALTKLRPEHLVTYCLSKGWELAEQRTDGKVRLLGAAFEGGRYELILPNSDAKNFRTQIQRSIYKLCGIEDREPAEILQNIVTVCEKSAAQPVEKSDFQSLKLRNSTSAPLLIEIKSHGKQRELLVGEALELQLRCASGCPEIEFHGQRVVVHDV